MWSVKNSQTKKRVIEHITGAPLVQQQSNSSQQSSSLSSNDEIENTSKSLSSNDDFENTSKKRCVDTVDESVVLDGVADSLSARHTNDNDVAELHELLPILFPDHHATNTYANNEIGMSGRSIGLFYLMPLHHLLQPLPTLLVLLP